MELFSEVYGCYYTVVSRILGRATDGLTRVEIEDLVNAGGFHESAFHLLPSLFSGEWRLLDEKDKRYYSRLDGKAKRPLSMLEKSWLKSLTEDPRIKLFLDDKQLDELKVSLEGVAPLYQNDDFHTYGRHLDGDDFVSSEYASCFKTILQATKEHRPLLIGYESPSGTHTLQQYLPYKLSFSGRDDKFRLLCATYNKRHKKLQRMILNLARIKSVEVIDSSFDRYDELSALYKEALCAEPVVLEISTQRNALERCMLQFASFERQTAYDSERDLYTCRIWYDSADEPELLINILSFGPTVKVVGPSRFLNQVKDRIHRQQLLFRA